MANKQMVRFSGQIIEATVADKADVVDEWVQMIRSTYNGVPIMVGLDCEWKPNTVSYMNNKTATLQLCVNTKCLIVQLFYIDYVPQSLRNFLSDSTFTFVGVEVDDDVSKLRDEYMLYCTKTVDIQARAMSRWPINFYRKPGLKKLAKELVGLIMEKPMHVCRSNWENRILRKEQIEYACIDAYACFRIGHRLLNE